MFEQKMNYDLEEKNAIRYFFGELKDDELTAFEEKFFTDQEFSDWLAEFETDLIDDYLRGELSATEKMKFEEKYLVSQHRKERVKAATALWEKEKAQATAAVVETAGPTFWESVKLFFAAPRLSLVAPVILQIVLIGFIIFWIQKSPPEIIVQENEKFETPPTPENFQDDSPEITPTPKNSPITERTPIKDSTPTIKPPPSPTEKETPRRIDPLPPVLATITLFTSDRSGNEIKKVVLPKNVKAVPIVLSRDVKDDFDKYLVEVADTAGNPILTKNLPPKKSFFISIPAKHLQNGNYKITLKGVKEDETLKTLGNYYFSVEKK
jgi:hypothetical protein